MSLLVPLVRSGRACGPRPGRWWRPAPAGWSSGSPAACPRTRTAAGGRTGSSSVSAWLSSVIQVRLRNSTHTRSGAARCAQARMYSLRRPADREPGRELQQDRAELARVAQRLERGQEPVPRLVGHLRVDVLEVDPVLAGLLRGLAQVGGQRRDRGGVLGEQAERLDVEGEPGRGPRRPGRGGLLGGQRVVGGVHLDQRELAGVIPQPLLRRVRLRRIPAGRDQRPVGPRRRARPDLPHGSSVGIRRTGQRSGSSIMSRNRTAPASMTSSRLIRPGRGQPRLGRGAGHPRPAKINGAERSSGRLSVPVQPSGPRRPPQPDQYRSEPLCGQAGCGQLHNGVRNPGDADVGGGAYLLFRDWVGCLLRMGGPAQQVITWGGM